MLPVQDSASLAQCLQLLASQAGLLLQSAAWADGAWQGLREAAEQHISRQLSRQGSLTFLAAQQQLSWLLDGSTAEDAAQVRVPAHQRIKQAPPRQLVVCCGCLSSSSIIPAQLFLLCLS